VLGLRRPEGYAYYALDPEAYAARARTLPVASASVTVLGVRSIGTSLSAVVAAVLRQRGPEVRRITVRPHGHPWNREIGADDPALEVLREGRTGELVIVDEGPGLSGSTLLAVAEAAISVGVPPAAVTILCGRVADPQRMVAPDAARRWSRFRVAAIERNPIAADEIDLSAGRWRSLTHGRQRTWPASWQETEREKRLAPERGELSKFVGFSPYGERAAATASLLADAGVACVILGRSEDRDAARDIKGLDLIGRTDLMMLMGVVSHCSVVVANDSGALHLAGGLGVPVVGIWGPTNERYSTPVTPYEDSRTVAAISESVFCRPCFLADCPIDHRCMKRIPTARVHDAVRRFLQESHA
jgi:hypothetical protein